MLRINLLPSYVAQRRLSKRLVYGFGALFVVLGLVLFLWYASILSAVKSETQMADNAVQGQQVTQGLRDQATSETSKIAPIQARVDFVKQVHLYNLSQAALYARMAHYTIPGITYTDASYSGSIMTMKAYTPSFHVLVQYLERIRKNPDYSQVVVDHVPSYANAYLTKYYLGHTLVSIGTPPGGQSGAGQGGFPGAGRFGAPGMNGGPGMGGAPGMGGGFPGAGGPGTPGGTAGSQYGKTLLNNALSSTETVTPLDQIIQSHISPLALPRQAAEAALQLQEEVYSKRVPTGFFFTVTATLVKPLTPPTVPGNAGGAATPGAMGGPGGFGPGMGAPPGMGGPGGPPVQTASNVGNGG